MGTNQRRQIEMTDDEVQAYLAQQRTMIMVTNGPSGHPHAVAMWYGLVDGAIWFETKAKSQKAVNLRRDPKITCLIEDGHTYDTLRGASFEGTATIVDDPDALWQVGLSVWERYTGPYTEEAKPLVEFMLHNRVAVRVDVERTRTWDHRKLGMDPLPLGGTTAEFL
ncbi:MAG: PPOX class F420-dependent oxidoreductase [Acidimicrobiales bacterium]|nr:PPOX class F420-dependent oxidoreductase [Acidimicrobiales bacterium]